MSVLGAQQGDSAIHVYTYIIFHVIFPFWDLLQDTRL